MNMKTKTSNDAELAVSRLDQFSSVTGRVEVVRSDLVRQSVAGATPSGLAPRRMARNILHAVIAIPILLLATAFVLSAFVPVVVLLIALLLPALIPFLLIGIGILVTSELRPCDPSEPCCCGLHEDGLIHPHTIPS